MPEGIVLGFDFGFKRIGVAVGQRLTGSASPLTTLNAKQGVPNWEQVTKLLEQWRPQALVVGVPVSVDGSALYTTKAARRFAKELTLKFNLPTHLVDERFTTVEARAQLFEKGGYRKLQTTQIDSIAACLIIEQWLSE